MASDYKGIEPRKPLFKFGALNFKGPWLPARNQAATLKSLSQLPQPKFPAGQIALTTSIIDLVERGRLDPVRYLRRHLKCDWGDQYDADWQDNDTAVRTGEDRLLSIYGIGPDLTLWIITDGTRTSTTLMLPEEH